MSFEIKKLKRITQVGTVIAGTTFITLITIAYRNKKNSIFENVLEQKNPMEGKKVIFVEDDSDVENADGKKGHLEAIEKITYFPGFYDKYVKRVFDVFLSFVGLIVLSPVFLGLAIAIKIDDPGPVFFTQKRVGKNKKYFKLHKFRSMKMSTPHDIPTHMLGNPEQYITHVGRFMRKHSIDELPQIWDIFVGNMSIVGPRPGLWNQDFLISERDKYGANNIKPGLTGWAQINGRDELEISEKAKLDGEYVQKIGFLIDVKCFFRTIHVLGRDENVIEGGTGIIKNNSSITLPSATFRNNLDFFENKKILIGGANSYIGEAFKKYLSKFNNYEVDCFDTKSDGWKNLDFSSYDVVYDVAGLVHIKETNKNRHLYYAVNRDLAAEMAKKAKAEGVKQFIYLSSMSVYGCMKGEIDKDTLVCPRNAYGRSKMEAEKLIWQLCDENFTVSIVRPPMVYGKDCKGNYQILKKFARKFCFFPDYENERSMIHIDNLSSAIRGIIHNDVSGLYFPQDPEYIRTYDMVKKIVEANGKRFISTKIFNVPIRIVMQRNNTLKKVFGSLTYRKSMNIPIEWMNTIDNNYPIEKQEKKMNNGQKGRDDILVTILTAAYNREKTIAKTMESVLNQTYKNIEYIVIDGASKDGTLNVARSYQKVIDCMPGRFLKIISEPDNSMYEALNKGANIAQGELVGQINTDDWYELDAVENMVKLYRENPYDVAWGSLNVIKDSGNVVKHARIGRLWTTSGWCHPAMFSRREILLEYPYICESMYDDFEFITHVHSENKKIITTDIVIANFTFGGMTTQKKMSDVKKRIKMLSDIYDKYGMSKLYSVHRVFVEMAKYILA